MAPLEPSKEEPVRSQPRPAANPQAAGHSPGRLHRRHPRFRCSFPVAVTLLSGDDYKRLEAHCKDLSEAGIGMLIAAELTVGEVVSLTFSVPGLDRTWDIHAVLRHRHGYHYGFEFLSLRPELLQAVKDHLRKLERVD